MSRTPKPGRRDEPSGLSFLDTARRFYGDAFGSRRQRAIDAARDDWADLPEEDRSFAVAHLLYLDIMGKAASTRLLLQVRDLLEEIADALPDEPEELEDDDDQGEDDDDDDDDEPELFDPEPTATVPGQVQPEFEPLPVEPDDVTQAEHDQGELDQGGDEPGDGA